ncbi:MAG: hypothetical protein IJX80_00590 [Clostridia bacterium]|nr:hypothetical protein [Clostridia bacterium]
MNYSDTALRQRYIDFIREGMYEVTYGAVKAWLAVAPDTRFGLEYEHMHNYHGANDEHLLGALHDASGREVETRSGGGYYYDKSPWEQYSKALCLSAANSLLPPYVTACVAEIENLPGVVLGKSIGGILNEGTLDLAICCTGLTFTDVQSCHEPMEYYEKIFAGFSKIRPYWTKLSVIAKQHARGGVAIYWGEAPQLAPSNREDPLIAWDSVLLDKDIRLTRVGVPLTYDQRKHAAYLVHHSTVDALTDRDIEFLLTHPVITDGESVAKLFARGFADRFAFVPRPIDNRTEEHFTASPINRSKAGMFYNENPYAAAPMQRFVFDGIDERTAVLGEAFRDSLLDDGSCMGACTVVTEIQSSNAKWTIFGYSLWSNIISSAKQNQIVGALDAIGPMPVRLLSEEQVVAIPSVDECGRTLSVTLESASQGGTEPFEVLVRKPRGKQILAMSVRRPEIGFIVVEEEQDDVTVRIQALEPYEIVTLFFE